MTGIGETGDGIFPAGYDQQEIVVGELVEAGVAPGHDLRLWDDQSAAPARIGRVLAGGDIDRFAGGPLTLHETQVDGVAAWLIAAQVRVDRDSGPPEVEAVEIDLEAARRNPKLILGMIRTAPPTEFQRRVIDADVEGFEKRFAQYIVEGKKGLWDSLVLTPEERAAAKGAGMSRRQAARDNEREIDRLRAIEDMPFRNRIGSGFQETSGLGRWVFDYIVRLDRSYKVGQPGAFEGLGSAASCAKTQERMERLAAVQYAFRIGEPHGGNSEPVDADPHPTAVDDPESLKLMGLRYVIDGMWADYEKRQFVRNPTAYVSGDRLADMPDELLDMEALYTALAAKNTLLQQQGVEAGMELLVDNISRIESIRANLRQNQRRGSFLALEAPDYAEEDFRGDVLVAGAVRKVIGRFGTSTDVAAFELSTLKRISESVQRGSGVDELVGVADVSARPSALSAYMRLGLTADNFHDLVVQALGRVGEEGGPNGASSDELVNWLAEAQAGYAARKTDPHGRYAEQERRRLESLGAAQRQEDFPGEGRMLCYYGDLNLAEGSMGVLEALGVTSGLYQHVDAAGNLPNNPLSNAAVRTQLEGIARGNGFSVEVHPPFRISPPDYKCEAAHFVGRMQRHIKPEHILTPVIPGGFATLQVESNRQLVQQIKQADAGRFRYMELPSELVRFLRRGSVLVPQLGHITPGWKDEWKDHTLAIFFNDADGSPSDLYREVYRLLSHPSAPRQIER